MSPKLQMLARQMGLPPVGEKAPVPDTSGLGAALEQMIQAAVEQRVSEALEHRKEHQSPRVQRLLDQFNAPVPYTDYRQIPPTPKTAPAKNFSAQLMRDGAGVTRWVQVGNVKLEVLRDGADRVIGMRQVDESPVMPQPDASPKAEAREYQPSEPRT